MQTVMHNLTAQFSKRQLNITTEEKGKSAEKLSSGYRINRSADDAAGLQISEKLRWQTRGLHRAADNIEDGISLIQVADGALNESHAVLQRMRELSVQAANDTNTDEDRAAIQKEIDNLTKEVDRIADVTSFNSDIYPLKAGAVSNRLDLSVFKTTTLNILNDTGTDVWVDGLQYKNGDNITINGALWYDEAKVCCSNILIGRKDASNIWASFYGTTGINKTSLTVTGVAGNSIVFDVTRPYNLFYATPNDIKIDRFGYLCISNPKWGHLPWECHFTNRGLRYVHPISAEDAEAKGCIKPSDLNKGNSPYDDEIWIQMGAQNKQGMFLTLVNATAKGVGITDPSLDITSYAKANMSISRLDKAIDRVSSYRSSFGAQQNRLEYAKSVDDNTAENTQSAESRLRDTDMAEQMVQFSKHNILEQAGQAMLAQANQGVQGILTLLQ